MSADCIALTSSHCLAPSPRPPGYEADLNAAPGDLQQLPEQIRLLKTAVADSFENVEWCGGNSWSNSSPVNHRYARCIRTFSTRRRSLVMPYKYPINKILRSNSRSIEGRPVSL